MFCSVLLVCIGGAAFAQNSVPAKAGTSSQPITVTAQKQKSLPNVNSNQTPSTVVIQPPILGNDVGQKASVPAVSPSLGQNAPVTKSGKNISQENQNPNIKWTNNSGDIPNNLSGSKSTDRISIDIKDYKQ